MNNQIYADYARSRLLFYNKIRQPMRYKSQQGRKLSVRKYHMIGEGWGIAGSHLNSTIPVLGPDEEHM